MSSRMSTLLLWFCACTAPFLAGQQKSASPAPSDAKEFPVLLQQSVIAGKTPVGSVVKAKLMVATLVNGTVVPRNATFTGEVVESVAKTATDPSRLAIRMASVEWKKGSTPVNVYVTSWYYPATSESGQDLQYGPQKTAQGSWNGAGQYPDPHSKIYQPFPSSDSDKDSSTPPSSSPVMSSHRVPIPQVEAARSSDGGVELVSSRVNLKLDKLTTYVLAADDLASAK
jgi:hypothetical protein